MREAAGSAISAARPVAHMIWRVDIAFNSLKFRPVASRKMLKPALTLADTRLLAECRARPQEWQPCS
jgi:hypothetical protein